MYGVCRIEISGIAMMLDLCGLVLERSVALL